MTVTSDQAMVYIQSLSRRDLYEECRSAYSDLQGIRKQPMHDFTTDQLLDWWKSVYEWDEAMQSWTYTLEVQRRFEWL